LGEACFLKITSEADYAIRIVAYLAKVGEKRNAETISAEINVPFRLTLKILRKLSGAGIVKSFRGISGGYMLTKPPGEITLKDVLELIDGPIKLSKCSDIKHCCRHSTLGDFCPFSRVFYEVGEIAKEKFQQATFENACTDD